MKARDFIFKRYKPDKKLEFIKDMTQSELMNTSYDIIQRCIKDAGERKYNSSLKRLYFNRVSNHSNSTINCVEELNRTKIICNIYIQGDDTDMNDYVDLKLFLNNSTTEVFFDEETLHSKHRVFARWYVEDKAEVIRNILISYVNNKYKV